jgi:enamine deaminase RidA (YjgF/YER057c/UK114 family)
MDELVEPRLDGGYDVDLKGYQVSFCRVDMRFGLELAPPRPMEHRRESVTIKLAGPFDVVMDGESHTFDAGSNRAGLGPALSLLWRTVASAQIGTDGTLEVDFEDQTVVRTPSDPRYEAWEITEDNKQTVICMPRGHIEVWGPEPKTPPARISMTKAIINPRSLAKPVGFNHGIVSSGGRLLFLAGQDASDGEGRIVAPGDVVGQLHQVLRNLRAVVEAAGGTMENIVKLNIYVRDRDGYVSHLKALGRVFRNEFGHYYPTMALFEVSRLFQDDALIELEGIAVLT